MFAQHAHRVCERPARPPPASPPRTRMPASCATDDRRSSLAGGGRSAPASMAVFPPPTTTTRPHVGALATFTRRKSRSPSIPREILRDDIPRLVGLVTSTTIAPLERIRSVRACVRIVTPRSAMRWTSDPASWGGSRGCRSTPPALRPRTPSRHPSLRSCAAVSRRPADDGTVSPRVAGPRSPAVAVRHRPVGRNAEPRVDGPVAHQRRLQAVSRVIAHGRRR